MLFHDRNGTEDSMSYILFFDGKTLAVEEVQLLR